MNFVIFMDLVLLDYIGRIQNGQYLEKEEKIAVLHSTFHSCHFLVPQAMVWKSFTLTYFLIPTDLWLWRSNWGQKVIFRIGSSKSICILNMKTIASLVPEICQIIIFFHLVTLFPSSKVKVNFDHMGVNDLCVWIYCSIMWLNILIHHGTIGMDPILK